MFEQLLMEAAVAELSSSGRSSKEALGDSYSRAKPAEKLELAEHWRSRTCANKTRDKQPTIFDQKTVEVEKNLLRSRKGDGRKEGGSKRRGLPLSFSTDTHSSSSHFSAL